MSNPKLKVAVENNYSKPNSIENGVVQGPVLSVTLFLVAMTDIVHSKRYEGTNPNHGLCR
jgi:hypothetical protein